MVVEGKLIRFDETRGYGFATTETGREDVFVHVNDLNFDKRLLAIGAQLQFEIEDSDRGPKASDIRLIRTAPPRLTGAVAVYKPAGSVESGPSYDGLCDVLLTAGYVQEVTEILVTTEPTMPAAQIVRIREQLTGLARKHGWIEE